MNFPEINKMPDAVFWDWDGTIVDSYQFLNDTHNYTLSKLGMDALKEGEFRNYFGAERMYVFSNIYGDKKKDAMDIFQKYALANNHMIKPIEGVRKVLELLQKNNVAMGVVTNKKRCYLKNELKHLGFNNVLPIVVCAAEASRDKPFPDPLLLAIKNAGLNVQNHDIWYAGDTETDIMCARNAGCRSVFLKGHKDTRKLLLKYSPYISFDDYSCFKDFLVAI